MTKITNNGTGADSLLGPGNGNHQGLLSIPFLPDPSVCNNRCAQHVGVFSWGSLAHAGAVDVVVIVSVYTSLGVDGKQVTSITYHGFHVGSLPCASDVGTGKRQRPSKNSKQNKQRKKRQSTKGRYEMSFDNSQEINLPLQMTQERSKKACICVTTEPYPSKSLPNNPNKS